MDVQKLYTEVSPLDTRVLLKTHSLNQLHKLQLITHTLFSSPPIKNYDTTLDPTLTISGPQVHNHVQSLGY